MKSYSVYLKTGVHNIKGETKEEAIENAILHFQNMLDGNLSNVDAPEYVAFSDDESVVEKTLLRLME